VVVHWPLAGSGSCSSVEQVQLAGASVPSQPSIAMNSVWQVAVDPGVGMIAAVVTQSLWQLESTQAKAVCIAHDFAHA
jgi:hypothetical protein